MIDINTRENKYWRLLFVKSYLRCSYAMESVCESFGHKISHLLGFQASDKFGLSVT